MLKVECESCRAPYQVDERRVPPGGLKMRCPKCGHTFLVSDPNAPKGSAPGKAAPAAPGSSPGAAAKPPPPVPSAKKATMVGIAGPAGKLGPPGAAAAPEDGGWDLPAAKPAAPPVKPPVAPTIQQKTAAPLPATKPTADFGDLSLDDLPAVADQSAGLPAPVRKPPPPAPPAAAGGGGFGDVDLPSVANHGDLPVTKARGDMADRTTASAQAFGTVDLPIVAPHGGGRGGGMPGFGGVDLPMLASDLPAVQNNLPMARGGGGGGGGFGEIDLPSVADNLPAPAGVDHHLPAPVSDDRLLPNQAGALPQVKLGDDFGDLELPRADARNVPTMQGPGAGMPLPTVGGEARPHSYQPPPDPGGFGELELPQNELQSLKPPASPAGFGAPGGAGAIPPQGGGQRGGGGMQFGEVDLGGGGDAGGSEAILSARPPAPTPSGAALVDMSQAQEASLEAQKRRARTVVIKKPSKAPKIVAALLAVLVVGGAALQLTPYGAYGHHAIGDMLSSGEYQRFTEESAEAARKRFATDTWSEVRQAMDDLETARKKKPRARQLAAYSALAEYTAELRFGADPERAAKAQLWLKEIPQGTEVAYLGAARAAQMAVAGDHARARRALDAAARNPKDPGQIDMAILRGEIELAARDPAAAVVAFKKALELGQSSRAHFGLARAYFASGDMTKAKDEVGQVLAKTPQHAGALILRANVAWRTSREDGSALKDLAQVLEGAAKAGASTAELSRAYSSKGWVMFGRERAGDARAAFEEAIKLDARNVSALVGQAEVLYAEQRYTEALTRFDTAVTADPASVDAIIGAAKTKIALEKLSDAKGQLTAARAAYPKEMRVALWLGKAEEALGNKSAAEKSYNDAVELADPQNPDAISAYVALASLLASQGRAVEAQGKLDQARAKLPDSGALQRAIGDVAAAQGHYDEAIAHYEAALQKDPNDIATHFRLGVTLRRMRRMEQAAIELDKVLAVDKDYPQLALERGLLYEESGEVQKALEQFKSALNKAPGDLDLQLRVGAAYVAIGRADEALPMLQKVISQRPNSAEAQHFVGRAYLKKGGLDVTTALKYLKRAVELDPNRAEYHLYVAWACNESPQPDLGTARTEVDKAIALDKLLADAYWQRGDILRKGGAIEDAIRDLKKALELRPNRIEAHASLAEAYEQKNNLTAAEQEWRQAVAGNQEQPYWRFKYGRILLEKNQPGPAKNHLQYAVTQGQQLQPRPAWVIQAHFEAGEAFRRTGDKNGAVQYYCVFLETAPTSSPDIKEAKKALAEMKKTCDER